MTRDKPTGSAEFTAVSCALCGADDSQILFVGQDYWYGSVGDFPLCQCRRCGLIYQNPQPAAESIGQYYPSAYAPFVPALQDIPSAWRRWGMRRFVAKQIALVERFALPPGKALDIGCATGNFLAGLRDAGWDVAGVELDERAAEYARTVQRLAVKTGTLAAADLTANHFDLVTMWHVLEHVHEPVETLQEVARVTRPNGWLVIAVPNPDSWETRCFGRYWAGWDLPRHLYILDKAVMRRLLQKTGWEMVDVTTRFGRHWLLTLSVSHWLKEKWPSRKRLHRLILLALGSLPMKVALMPYFFLVEWLKKGSILIVVAKRCGSNETAVNQQ